MPILFQISFLEVIASHLADAETEADQFRESVCIEDIPSDHGEEYADMADELEDLRTRIADLHGELEDFINRVVDLRDRHPEA